MSMKKSLISLFCLFFCVKVFATTVAPTLMEADLNPQEFYSLRVEYPVQDKVMPANIKNMFLFGRVYQKDSKLKLNGQDIPLYKNGSFVIYQPLHPGEVEFLFEVISPSGSQTFRRNVFVPGFDPEKYEDKYKFDTDTVFPSSDINLRDGDSVMFSIYATPSKKMILNIASHKDILMTENPKIPGLYETLIVFNKEDTKYRSQKAVYKILGSNKKFKNKIFSRGKIRIYPKEYILAIGKLRKQNQRLRPEPQKGDHILETRLFGKLKITGQLNNFYRISLLDDQEGWLEEKYIKTASYFNAPKNNVWKVTAEEVENKSVLTVFNNNKTSFKTEQTPVGFEITLFNTQLLNTPQENLKTSLFSNISFENIKDDAQKIILKFDRNSKLWGFDFAYEGGNLVFNFYHAPKFAITKEQPLNGVKIVLDPGHSPKRIAPYDGAVGPSGMLEYEINYKIALKTKEKLEALGAIVFMSKEENENMPLARRQEKVLSEQAHLFISLHNNALPDQIDPLSQPRGFSFFYYYPHSYTFAEAIERSFVSNIALPDEGIIQRDFSVTRSTPQVPAILIEHAYMLLPEQEDLLSQDSFIDKLATATAKGVKDYIREVVKRPQIPTNNSQNLLK